MCNRHHQSDVEQSGISMWVTGLNLNQWRRMLKQRHHWLKLLDPSSCEIIKQESQRRYSAEDLSQSQALKTWAFHFMAKSPSPSWVVYKGGSHYERDLIFLSYLIWGLHVAFTILCSAISDWLAALSAAIIYYYCKGECPLLLGLIYSSEDSFIKGVNSLTPFIEASSFHIGVRIHEDRMFFRQ